MIRWMVVCFLVGYVLVGPWAYESMSHWGPGITGPG